MAILKCKMCGGDLNVSAEEKIIECEYCGSTQAIPDGSDEKKTNLFNRANRLRMDNEFDKAAGVYESIVSEFPEEAEGYWGLVLCSYGIEYVDDTKTGKKIPTCHRTLTSSIMDDDNFVQACENADVVARGIYREEAKAIDRLQQQIIAVVENEEPYDVFICYKETDDITKSRTEDSLIAQDIYTELIKEGYKVFFSRVTLRDKAGTEYEPYIYAALKSAKIMLAIGTKFDYYDAVWVKNEWSRYISMMADDSSKHLIPCFKNLDAYDIPKEFKNLQALDMGEVTFFKNLTDNVSRIIPRQKPEQANVVEISAPTAANATVDSLLKRAFMFLEDGNWDSANEYCEKVLDINPECAEAYLGKLMAELRVKKREELKNCKQPFDNNNNFVKTVRFADDNFKNELKYYIKYINARNIQEETERLYVEAQKLMDNKKCESCEKAAKLFDEIIDYKDAQELKEKCFTKIKEMKQENIKRIQAFRKIQEPYRIRNMQTNISAGRFHTVGLKTDGTVVAVGDNQNSQCNVKKWTDIVAISAGYKHTVGLKTDGTVVAVGDNQNSQCDVKNWTDIVAISAGENHTVGLKADGTVVAVGDNYFYGQINVKNWTDIVAISAGSNHTVGLKADGTVVAVGDNQKGRCNVKNWIDIVAISAGYNHTVGLKADGTVVAVGDNQNSQCNVYNWTDIVAISAGSLCTVGLKVDGTVVAAGLNDFNRCKGTGWADIVAISAGSLCTIGLKAAGTVVAVGLNDSDCCKVTGWTDIASPIDASSKEELIKNIKKKVEEKRRQKAELVEKKRQEEQQRLQYRNAGVCQYCGGTFKGLFSKTCTKCGKKKDY